MSSQAAALFTISPEQSALQWFELVFFAVTLPPITVNFLIHRRIPGGRLGWFFLWNFVAMRLVGFILLKVATTKDLFIAGTVISGASLSPLFFSTSGIWHEVAHWHRELSPALFGWPMQIIIHLAVGGAIGMTIAGAVTQLDSVSPPAYSRPLEIAGVSLLLVIWFGLCALLFILWTKPKSLLEKRLLVAVGLVLPLLALRTVYSLCGAAINNSTWSYYRGPLAAQVIMQVLPDCLIVIIYAVAGFITRDLAQERRVGSGQRESLDRYDGSSYVRAQQGTISKV